VKAKKANIMIIVMKVPVEWRSSSKLETPSDNGADGRFDTSTIICIYVCEYILIYTYIHLNNVLILFSTASPSNEIVYILEQGIAYYV
jgi:hypothetical protein